MSDRSESEQEPLSRAQREKLVKALVKLVREEERREESMKRLREKSGKQ